MQVEFTHITFTKTQTGSFSENSDNIHAIKLPLRILKRPS